MAQADTSFREDIADIDRYYVRNSKGNMLPLKTFVSYIKLLKVHLLFLILTFTVQPNLMVMPQKVTAADRLLQALRETADKVLPAGYGYEFSGLSHEEIEAGSKSILSYSSSRSCLFFCFLQRFMRAGRYHSQYFLQFLSEPLEQYWP